MLWDATEAVAATGGEARGQWAVNGVSIDTRSIAAGDLFVALSAARDGHDFVAAALSKGAGAAMVTHVPDGVPDDAPLLIVPDVLAALEDLGRAARARMTGRVVAVTGSVGKTSTKEMLRVVLGRQRKTHVAEASYNNHWGVPLTLARMPRDTELAVIEIGMSNPGEIAPLARMARPHVAMITTIAAAHLEAFSDLAAIAREKASIFEGLEPGGTAVINGDLDTSPILSDAATARGAKVITFGEAEENHHRLLSVDFVDNATISQARAWRSPVLFKIAAAGRHFALNALGVLAVAAALGLDRALAATDLAQWVPPAGRGMREVLVLDPASDDLSFELIDDAFNANPTSMAAALEVLAAAQPRDDVGRLVRGRRVAILGDMLELGPDEAAMHRNLGQLPAMAALDIVHCVGDRMQNLYETLPEAQRGQFAHSADELAAYAGRLVDAGDVVLVKGSKGSLVSHVVDALRKLGHPAAQ